MASRLLTRNMLVDASIKVDGTGRRHITYIERANRRATCTTLIPNREAWSQPEIINIDPGVVTGSESAAMLLDANDNLYVV